MYREYNPNPTGKKTEDCTVRAVCKATGLDWDTAYKKLAEYGRRRGVLMNNNGVWGALLEDYGFVRRSLPNTCPRCYTVAEFARDNRRGTFVLGTGTHVVTVSDGDWWDMWDSGSEVPIVVYWRETYGNQ